MLIGYSIAKNFEAVAELKGPPGTAAYVAPERCESQLLPRIGTGSDVWGLGATLYPRCERLSTVQTARRWRTISAARRRPGPWHLFGSSHRRTASEPGSDFVYGTRPMIPAR